MLCMTNELTAADLAIAQAEATRWSAYQDQKEVLRRAELAVDRASNQYFAMGETPGDLQYWRECIAVANRERAKLQAIGR